MVSSSFLCLGMARAAGFSALDIGTRAWCVRACTCFLFPACVLLNLCRGGRAPTPVRVVLLRHPRVVWSAMTAAAATCAAFSLPLRPSAPLTAAHRHML